MPKNHQGLSNLTTYLKTKFPWKEDYECELKNGEKIIFSYEEVKEGLNKVKNTDPVLYKILTYRFMTSLTRTDIASILHMDGSTLKRNWNKAMNSLQNWLLHGNKEVNQEGVDNPPLIEEIIVKDGTIKSEKFFQDFQKFLADRNKNSKRYKE